MRALCIVFTLFTLVVAGQPTAAPLAFDVASIKEAPPMDPGKMMSGQMRLGMKIDGARAEYNFMSLQDLICAAYKVKPYQLSGPDWMKTQRWDIQATMPEGAPKEKAPEMLQSLLKERFKMEIHRDTKEHNIYALVQGKNGHKMKEAEPDAPPPPVDPKETEKPEETKDAKGPGAGGGSMTVNGEKMVIKQTATGATIKGGEMGAMKVSMNNGLMHMEYGKVEMSKFVEMLTAFVDRPVVDETQLKGKYQVTLDLAMADMMGAARKAGMGAAMGGGPPMGAGGPGGGGGGPRPAESASDPGGSSIFTSVEALGLKLAPRKGPVEMIVVDKIEKTPTEN